MVSQGKSAVVAYSGGKVTPPVIKAGVDTPRAIALAPDGRIFVANFVTVTSYLPNGQRTQPTLTHINPASAGLDSPMALAVDARGLLYVGYDSGAVETIGLDGKPARPYFQGVRFIRGIAVR